MNRSDRAARDIMRNRDVTKSDLSQNEVNRLVDARGREGQTGLEDISGKVGHIDWKVSVNERTGTGKMELEDKN